MCVITGLATIGGAIATAVSAAASAAAAAGSAIAAGVSSVGGALGGLASSGAAALGASSGVAAGTGVVVSGAAQGAIYGASLGAATGGAGAAIGGGDVGEGILRGMGMGAATGGALGGLGALGEAADVAASMKNSSEILQASEGIDQMGTQGREVAQLMQEAGNAGQLKTAVDVAPTTTAGTGAASGGVKASTAELLAKGAVAAGTGIAMGTMSYQSAVKAAEAQARAQEDQAEQMKMAGELAKQNAANARTKAGMEMESGELDAADKARISRQEAGSAIAKAAGSGVMIEPRKESMTTSLEADQKAELVYDQAKIMQNAQMRAWGYMAEGLNYDMEALGQSYGAASLRSAARETRRAGRVNALTSAFGTGLSTGASVGSLLI